VNRWNQRFGRQAYRELLGASPRIALVNEMSFSSGMVDVYAEAGYAAIMMDRDNVRLALDLDERPIADTPTHAIGSAGATLPVLWADSVMFQRLQRVVHGDITMQEYLGYVRQRVEGDGVPLPIYANDAEIFDYRPGRFAAESRLHASGEWSRMREVFERLTNEQQLQWLGPSAVLDLQEATQARRPAVLSSVTQPLPVKKQTKYNINRWAVAGRDNLWLNSQCHRVHAQLVASGESSPEQWRNLAELWASDLRTHITESRWAAAVSRIAQALPDAQPLTTRVASGKTSRDAIAEIRSDSEGIVWSVETPSTRLQVNLRRGLTINELGFASQQFAPLIGTLGQGYFSTIELGADFYSGGVLMELPVERRRITDLDWVSPDVNRDGDEIVMTAELPLKAGPLRKTVAVNTKNETVRLGYDFPGWPRPLGFVRVGVLTMIPEAFTLPLMVSCVNGGASAETFLIDRDVDHGAASSLLVSSRSAFGATTGRVSIVDANGRGFEVQWDPAVCAAVPMLKHQGAGNRHLTRLFFSLTELDDTSRPGGRLLPFEFTITPVTPRAPIV
jgi:hypothetical protein